MKRMWNNMHVPLQRLPTKIALARPMPKTDMSYLPLWWMWPLHILIQPSLTSFLWSIKSLVISLVWRAIAMIYTCLTQGYPLRHIQPGHWANSLRTIVIYRLHPSIPNMQRYWWDSTDLSTFRSFLLRYHWLFLLTSHWHDIQNLSEHSESSFRIVLICLLHSSIPNMEWQKPQSHLLTSTLHVCLCPLAGIFTQDNGTPPGLSISHNATVDGNSSNSVSFYIPACLVYNRWITTLDFWW